MTYPPPMVGFSDCVTVTFNATAATPDVGTPPWPVTFNTYAAPVPAAFPTFAPARVFKMRVGVNATNVDAVGVGVGVGVGGGTGAVGVTGADAAEAPLVPIALVAVTV